MKLSLKYDQVLGKTELNTSFQQNKQDRHKHNNGENIKYSKSIYGVA